MENRNPFRAYLEAERGLSEWSAVRYSNAAGHFLAYCNEHGFDLERGAVPESLIDDFAAAVDNPRWVRGALLLCEFMRRTGVPLPEFTSPDTLDIDQTMLLLAEAAKLSEPYATLLHLLPMSGLRAADLLRLELDDVIETGGLVELRHRGELIRLNEAGAALVHGYLHGYRAHLGQDCALLFLGRTGKSIAASTITAKLKQCQQAAGLHDFRVTALSDLYYLYFEPETGPVAHEPRYDDEDIGPCGVDDNAHLDGLSTEALDDDDAFDEHSAFDDEHGAFDAVFDEPDPSGELLNDENETFEPSSGERDLATTTPQHPERADENVSHNDDNNRRPNGRSNGRSRPRSSGQTNPKQPLPAAFRKLIPAQGTLHFRHLPDDGSPLKYCGPRPAAEIAPHGGIEPFIYNQLAPRWGGGEYFVYDTANGIEPLASVHIAAMPKREPGPSTPGAAQHPNIAAGSPPISTLRELSNFAQELNKSPASEDLHLRIGRLEAMLEMIVRELERERRPSFDSAPFGFPGSGPVPHAAPWAPPTAVGSAPLPDRPEPEQRLVVSLFENQQRQQAVATEDRRLQQKIDAEERRHQQKIDAEERQHQREMEREERHRQHDRDIAERRELRERAERERTQREADRTRFEELTAQRGNPFALTHEALSATKSLVAEAREVVNIVSNDNGGGSSHGPMYDLANNFVGSAGTSMGAKVGEVVSALGDSFGSGSTTTPKASRSSQQSPRSQRTTSSQRPVSQPKPQPSQPARKRSKTSTTSAKKSKKKSKKKRKAAASGQQPAATRAPAETAAHLSVEQLPKHVLPFFKGPGQELDQAAATGTDEQLTHKLMAALGTLMMDLQWKPVVQATLEHLMADHRSVTLQRLGTILAALVIEGHLDKHTAKRVLDVADCEWDGVREQIVAAFEQRNRAARG